MSARPIRVVRIIARLNVGGPARHVALLQRHLPSRGYSSTLVTGLPGHDEAEMPTADAAGGVAIERTVIPELGRAVRAGDDLRAFRRISRLLRDLNPDIVHTHTAKAGALGRVAAAAYNARRPRHARAVIIHTFHGHVLHGYFGPAMDRAVRMTERGLAALSDRIIAISPTQRRDLVERFHVAPSEKVSVVPLGLDLDRLATLSNPGDLRRVAGFPDDAIVCGFVGRLVPIKHADLLLRAFARIAARDARARLLVVGDGECRGDLERLAAELGIRDRVHFAGWQADLLGVYGAMDVVALTSRNEGTPVALIEAGAAGKAIVAANVGGVADVVTADRTGLLVPDDDLDRFADALARLMQDPGERARLGAAARADMVARFGYGRLVDDLDALYRDALGRRHGDRPMT